MNNVPNTSKKMPDEPIHRGCLVIWHSVDGLSHLLLGERGLKVMQVPCVKVELLPVEIFWSRALFFHGIGEVSFCSCSMTQSRLCLPYGCDFYSCPRVDPVVELGVSITLF